MAYVIKSGRYESGTEEQQMGFRQLFGEEVQYRFDLYFHWYNLIHELGHSFVSESGLQMSDIRQEMFVNEFAVGYYRYAGEAERLGELQNILQEITEHMPVPMPEGETFLDYYERIWNTEELMQVMIYGYFQLNSVLEAMRNNRSFADVAEELGFKISPAEISSCDMEVTADNAEKVLDTVMANMKQMALTVPEVRLQLQDDPTIQCVRWDSEG